MNDIVTRKDQELSEEKISLLLQFENLESLIKAYEQHDWTPDDEMKELISIARDSDKDATRLAAIKTLQARRIEILKHAGLIVSATQTKDMPDGTRTVLSTERVRSLLSGETNYDDTQKETETQIIKGTPQATGQAGDADNPTRGCGPSREASSLRGGECARTGKASTDSSGEARGKKRTRGPGGRFLKRGDRADDRRSGRCGDEHVGTGTSTGDRNDGNSGGRGTDTGHTGREPEVPDIPIALDRPPSEADILPGLAKSVRAKAFSPSEPTEAV